jgi:formylglycine-generating enzyme required for sulfatase activity
MKMSRIVYLVLLAFTILHVSAVDAVQRELTVARGNKPSQNRVALVIGNAAYHGASALLNPVNDAKAMSNALNDLGFEVIESTNATQKEMYSAVTLFGNKLNSQTVALFFYAGHGLQVKGKNYIVPIDAQIGSESAVASEGVSVDTILEQVSVSPVSIVILDACRNNPFERSFRKMGGGGLAQMDAPKGSFIAYATAPGKTAADGEGSNGLFTQELLKQIREPGLEIEKVFKRVRAGVATLSRDEQMPWDSSSMTGEFFFKPGSAATIVNSGGNSVKVKTKDEIEDDYWEQIRDTQDVANFAQYLKEYPKGRYLNIANFKQGQLKKVSQVSPIVSNAGVPDAESELWSEVQKSDKSDDYLAYIIQYPKGKFIALAKGRLNKRKAEEELLSAQQELTVWDAAASEPSELNFKGYLNQFPQGLHASLALAGIENLKNQASDAVSRSIKPGQNFHDCPDCPEMVVIPSGSFDMGSPNSEVGRFDTEGPVHRVNFMRNFALGKHEVTREQYALFIKSTGYNAGENCWTFEDGKYEERNGRNWQNPGFSQEDNHPVVCLNWNDATAYINWLTRISGRQYRLPTEAEWEYAARGHSGAARYWGESSEGALNNANVADASCKSMVPGVSWEVHLLNDGYPFTSPVGAYQANGFGLYDMIGNAWEWVEDSWHENYGGAPNAGSAWSGDGVKRLLRGGSWVNGPRSTRSSIRFGVVPLYRLNSFGFRVARSVDN